MSDLQVTTASLPSRSSIRGRVEEITILRALTVGRTDLHSLLSGYLIPYLLCSSNINIVLVLSLSPLCRSSLLSAVEMATAEQGQGSIQTRSLLWESQQPMRPFYSKAREDDSTATTYLGTGIWVQPLRERLFIAFSLHPHRTPLITLRRGGRGRNEDLGLSNRTLVAKKPNTETIQLACICRTFDEPSLFLPYACRLSRLDPQSERPL